MPPLTSGDEPANDHFDVPLLQRLYSGNAKLEGLEGFTEHARIRVTQSVPAPFKLQAIRYEISY